MRERDETETARRMLQAGLDRLAAIPDTELTPEQQDMQEGLMLVASALLEIIDRADRQDAVLEELLRRTGGPLLEEEAR